MSAAASSSTSVTVRTLTDGGQQPLEIAHAIADWLGEARESLDLAQYDFHLAPESKAVAGVPDLMHHKYVVRDGEAVWTGSMNWTDDSWSRQENVIVTVESHELAALFLRDFEQLWEKDLVEETGFVPPERLHLGDVLVRPWFTPGYGEDLSHRIAKTISRAKRRVRICSPVITAAPGLATPAQPV